MSKGLSDTHHLYRMTVLRTLSILVWSVVCFAQRSSRTSVQINEGSTLFCNMQKIGVLVERVDWERPNLFYVYVEEHIYFQFCQYVKENSSNLECDNPRIPKEVKQAIDAGIKEYLATMPECVDSKMSFHVNKSILLTTFLEEHVVSSKCLNEYFAEEKHEGIILYEGRQYFFISEFSFRPSVLIDTGLRPTYYEVWLLPEKKHSGYSSNLISACKEAIVREAEAHKREKFESEKKAWIEYYEANRDAFDKWFAPLLDSPRACSIFKGAIRAHVPSKRDIFSYEHGRCSRCINFCQLIDNTIPWDKHSPQWYELDVEHHCPDVPES